MFFSISLYGEVLRCLYTQIFIFIIFQKGIALVWRWCLENIHFFIRYFWKRQKRRIYTIYNIYLLVWMGFDTAPHKRNTDSRVNKNSIPSELKHYHTLSFLGNWQYYIRYFIYEFLILWRICFFFSLSLSKTFFFLYPLIFIWNHDNTWKTRFYVS